MPYPNEHAARVRNPDSFESTSFRSKELKDGVRLILGKLKGGNDSMVVQAYRFPVNKFTVEQAKKWLEDNNIKYSSFELANPALETGGTVENKIEHTGVLGMKWGVRRSAPAPGGRQDKRWENKAFSTHTYVKVYNRSADRINKELPAFNAKYKNVNLKNKKNFDGYIKAYQKKFEAIANEELAKEIRTSSPSGTKRIKAVMNTETGWMGISIDGSLDNAKHADDISQLGFQLHFDENGFITGIELVDKSITHKEDIEDLVLHSGVLGMKWGRRSGGTTKTSGRSSKKKNIKTSDDFKKISQLKKKKIDEMSNEEISTVIKRMDLQKRYKDVNPSKVKAGTKTVGKVLNGLGQVNATIVSIAALAVIGQKFFTKMISSIGGDIAKGLTG